MDNLITIKNASFGYGGAPVLSGISLDVQRGEFAGLVGPNGAGKTTLLRGILGLIAPASGSVAISVGVKEKIGYVPQRDTLDPIYPLTATDVVRMTAASKDNAKRALEKVGMKGSEKEQFAELSGGQRQRVLIARALAIDPVLLVLDEPTAGIDREAERQILDFLTWLNRDGKVTVLMVSHHIETFKDVLTRVLKVEAGGLRPREEI